MYEQPQKYKNYYTHDRMVTFVSGLAKMWPNPGKHNCNLVINAEISVANMLTGTHSININYKATGSVHQNFMIQRGLHESRILKYVELCDNCNNMITMIPL